MPYQKAWFVGDRTEVLKQVIDDYKFRRVKAASHTLADLLDLSLPVLPDTTVVVSVPTVASHIRIRGYDHALLMARQFAALRKLTAKQLIGRRRSTEQRGQSRRARLAQLSDVFVCERNLDPSLPYLLVDDIVTTGATLRHCAQALRDAGAELVWVAAVARQPLDK